MDYGKKSYKKVKISIASPEKIRGWSYGEVTKPETINYRSLKPEEDGLFCEKIFGTTKEWECKCGKFKGYRYKGIVCDKCGVEVTHFKVRRERIGHIELSTPVIHIWFYRVTPSKIGLLLDMTVMELKNVIYYKKYIVTDPGNVEGFKRMMLLTEEEYYRYRADKTNQFKAGIGGEVIKDLLLNLNIEKKIIDIREKMQKRKVVDRRKMVSLSLLENFINSENYPEWMVLDVIPVIPPELRPMVQLDGGRFATSDLNDLYRRVINRNNRLKKLMSLNAPEMIIKNEKRMLQEAVDALFDNSKKKKVVQNSTTHSLKSLSDVLKGKQGRFRQNLLGKRVDYSGRSVIVVGPNLKLHQCGLPKKMALELFKPFIINKLLEKGMAHNIKSAKMIIDTESEEVMKILQRVTKNHPVLLNRAPTLHRLGMQAFEPILIEEKTIQLHPLVCTAYNADFDGDQMAVHVLISSEAQIEAWTLMLSANNLLDPANGEPIVVPSQDMILGSYNLSSYKNSAKGEGNYYGSVTEAIHAYEKKVVDIQAKILVKEKGKEGLTETSVGRIIFSQCLPKKEPVINDVMTSKNLKELIFRIFKNYKPYETVKMLDKMKDICFRYSTIFADTISVSDIIIPRTKQKEIDKAKKEVLEIDNQYQNGIITNEERYQKTLSLWTYVNDTIGTDMVNTIEKDKDGANSLYIMANSGARGSKQQIRQLGAMRGLMAKPSGEIIEMPITSNFKEGLNILEYFISTHGARKGLSDTALKTADAGYLTRKLVDVCQDVVIVEDDCGTITGIDVYPIRIGDEIVEKLSDRVEGRYIVEDIISPYTGEVILKSGSLVTEEICKKIDELEIEKVSIRTVVTCNSTRGICQKCYGMSLTNRKIVNIGEPVGIIASQSIGQPGTQLTMRTFHVGGAASSEFRDPNFKLSADSIIVSMPDNLVENEGGKKVVPRRGYLNLATVFEIYNVNNFAEIIITSGEKVKAMAEIGTDKKGEKVLTKKMGYIFHSKDKKQIFHVSSPYEKSLDVGGIFEKDALELIQKDEIIYTYDPYTEPIIVEKNGTISYKDIVLDKTLAEEVDEYTGAVIKKITDRIEDNLQPKLIITLDKPTEELSEMHIDLPSGTILQIEDGSKVKVGQIISSKIRIGQKTTDITGGLPRVQGLFEARHPGDIATIAKIDGSIFLGETIRGKRVITIKNEFGDVENHTVPSNKLLLVRDNDYVKAGTPLSEGDIDPHDILQVLGEIELYRFILRNVQKVYKKQGVNINDKHIGIVVRQMLRKVEILDSGDSRFMKGEIVDKYKFIKENKKIVAEGGSPIKAKNILLGLTRSALNTESFISAASFQETSKTLTNAAIENRVDDLVGIKENVIIGEKIPAGTGLKGDIFVYKDFIGDLNFIGTDKVK